MESYALHRAYRAVDAFILGDLSRWYVKLARERTWIDADDQGKAAAYAVLHETLLTLAKLLAPLTPHLAEAVYQHLDGRLLSVHMLDWPRRDPDRRDAGLEASMALVQELVETVSKERQKGGRKLRWPVRLIAAKGLPPEAEKALASLQSIFLEQCNAKQLTLLRAGEEFPGMTYVLKPDPASIGKAYRALWPKIASILESRPPEEVKRALDKGTYQVGVEGQAVTIEPHMVRFDPKLPDDVAVVKTPHGEVYVDMRVTPEIRAEGYAREVIRRIQQMRKDIDLEVDDYIVTAIKAGREMAEALEAQRDLVARETRSRILSVSNRDVEAEYVVEWNDVDGQSVTVGLTPLHMSEALREFSRLPGLSPSKAMLLFDAGYKSLASLRAASRQELAAVEGLDPGDAARTVDALARPPAPEFPCPVCGAPLPAAARRCPRCGEPLGGEPTPCPRCNAPVPPGEGTCPVCGFSLSAQAPGAPSPARTVCPACDAMIPAGSEVCPSCGARLRGGPAVHGRAPAGAPETAEPLPPSSTYLVLEGQPEESYRLFADAVARGGRGLCVTRTYPQKLRERLGAGDVSVLWLSNVGKEDSIRPKDLEKLSLAVEQFVAREHGVVLLDGLEYLVTNNNFLTVLRLVQALRDQVAIHGAVLLLSMGPASLESHQLTLLEREVDRVIGGTSTRAA